MYYDSWILNIPAKMLNFILHFLFQSREYKFLLKHIFLKIDVVLNSWRQKQVQQAEAELQCSALYLTLSWPEQILSWPEQVVGGVFLKIVFINVVLKLYAKF